MEPRKLDEKYTKQDNNNKKKWKKKSIAPSENTSFLHHFYYYWSCIAFTQRGWVGNFPRVEEFRLLSTNKKHFFIIPTVISYSGQVKWSNHSATSVFFSLTLYWHDLIFIVNNEWGHLLAFVLNWILIQEHLFWLAKSLLMEKIGNSVSIERINLRWSKVN